MLWIQILFIGVIAVVALFGFLAKFLSRVNPDDVSIEQFAEEIFKKGVYILPCGGGVIAEPRWAVYRLKHRYGSEGLLKLALQLIRENHTGKEFREGVVWSVEGIVYHLGDKQTLEHLIKLRSIVLEEKYSFPYTQKNTAPDMLIAALAQKLDMPLPEGVEKLENRVIKEAYCCEDF